MDRRKAGAFAQGDRKMVKFGNRKTTVFGQTFDSKHEAERYLELRAMEREGKIRHLATQVPFELIPAQLDGEGKLLERPAKYIADFTYWERYETGFRFVVEDAKSPATRTETYRIKKKLLLYVHGIRIKEV